jgi:hypothetical protein
MLLIFINSIPIKKTQSELPHYTPCCLDNYRFLLMRIARAQCRQNATAVGVKRGDTLVNEYARFQVIPAVLLNIMSSGKWCCVLRRVVTNVSKYRSACIFMPKHCVNSNLQKVLIEWSRVRSEKKRIFNTCLSLMVNNINKLYTAAVIHKNMFSF